MTSLQQPVSATGSLTRAVLSGATASLLATACLALVWSALVSPLGEIAWLLCVVLGLYIVRRFRPTVSVWVQASFVAVMLVATATLSFVISWYVLGERL